MNAVVSILSTSAGVISAEQEALNLERVDLEKSSGTSESQDSHTRGQVVDGKPEVDSARPAWGQNSFVEQARNCFALGLLDYSVSLPNPLIQVMPLHSDLPILLYI